MSADLLRRAFRAWGRWFAARRLRRGLDGVHVAGLEATRALVARGPVIFAANHVCWWDAMLVVDLSARLVPDARVLVDPVRLEQHRFFRAFGAVTVDPTHPGTLRRSLKALADGLARPGDALWWFPQGRYRPAHLRPLALRPGVDRVARASGATIVPVALQYAFLQADRPAAFVRFGAPVHDLEALEAALIAELETIDAEVLRASGIPAPPGAGAAFLSAVAGRLGGDRA